MAEYHRGKKAKKLVIPPVYCSFLSSIISLQTIIEAFMSYVQSHGNQIRSP